ncbi:unnamed protein product, partial [Iphiclides podalirius]
MVVFFVHEGKARGAQVVQEACAAPEGGGSLASGSQAARPERQSVPPSRPRAPPLAAPGPTLARLRVLTAPPTCVQELAHAPHAAHAAHAHSPALAGRPRSRPAAPAAPASPVPHSPSSLAGEALSPRIVADVDSVHSDTHFKRGGRRAARARADQSFTQFAVMDDENVSALQQVTKGGALTLVSLWKSQFDDSEETTDNEWKQEQLQSPEHRGARGASAVSSGSNAARTQLPATHTQHTQHTQPSQPTPPTQQQPAPAPTPPHEPHHQQLANQVEVVNNAETTEGAPKAEQPVSEKGAKVRCCLHSAGIEAFPRLQPVLPRSWSLPAIGTRVRALRPPLLQQASFDGGAGGPEGGPEGALRYSLDVMRGVAARGHGPEPPPEPPRASSLPDVSRSGSASGASGASGASAGRRLAPAAAAAAGPSPGAPSPSPAPPSAPPSAAERTVSSRLEIRVRARTEPHDGAQVRIHSVVSGGEPFRLNHEEASVYYDATEHQRDKRSSTRSAEKSQSPAMERTRLDAITDRSGSGSRRDASAPADVAHSLRDRSAGGTSRIPVATGAPGAGAGAGAGAAAGCGEARAGRLAKCASWSGDGPLTPDPNDLTPGDDPPEYAMPMMTLAYTILLLIHAVAVPDSALRRRRQNANEKYAADPARELNLRFARPRHRQPPQLHNR